MSIGYACITVGVPCAAQKTTIQKNATPERLRELIAHNLQALDCVLDYNIKNDIRLFRISSDIVPFGSSPVNTLAWWDIYAAELAALGAKAKGAGMRLSMHPGQYTVINSPDAGVVARAVDDLVYHTRFLDALGLDGAHKIILHIGGVYGDKQAAIERFCESYRGLPRAVKGRLVIENDDKLFTVQDVLKIGRAEGIPVVFDNLHNAVNQSEESRAEAEWVALCSETWGYQDGPQKTHYSQQAQGRRAGSHSDTIELEKFLRYYSSLGGCKPDIMLEVKDKNLSAVKCINATRPVGHIKRLEKEWALYKYTVLEHSAAAYNEIRALLKDKAGYPAAAFYSVIERALALPLQTGAVQNAAQHVWGYCKDKATAAEKKRFEALLAAYKSGDASLAKLKGFLKRMASKYGQQYLLEGYYFVL